MFILEGEWVHTASTLGVCCGCVYTLTCRLTLSLSQVYEVYTRCRSPHRNKATMTRVPPWSVHMVKLLCNWWQTGKSGYQTLTSWVPVLPDLSHVVVVRIQACFYYILCWINIFDKGSDIMFYLITFHTVPRLPNWVDNYIKPHNSVHIFYLHVTRPITVYYE